MGCNVYDMLIALENIKITKNILGNAVPNKEKLVEQKKQYLDQLLEEGKDVEVACKLADAVYGSVTD